MQRQTLVYIRQGHVVAVLMPWPLTARISQIDMQFIAAAGKTDAQGAVFARRLDAMIDGILEQRLEHQRRHFQIGRHIDNLPFDMQALTETQLFKVEILPAQRNFIGQRQKFTMIAHQCAKEFRQLLERRFRAPRLGANQRKHRIQAVEQKVGTNACGQGLQARLGQGWRKSLGAHGEIKKHHSGGKAAKQAGPQQTLPAAVIESHETPEIEQQDRRTGRQQQHKYLPKPERHASQQIGK